LKHEQDKKPGEAIEWIKSIVIAVALALFIKTFIFNSTYVLGKSMYPTLHEKDRLFAVKLPLYFREPRRGEVVVLEAPDSEDKDYIKRVIGIEGDKIEIFKGEVYLNGNKLEENYITDGSYTHIYEQDTWLVPEDEVFVLGDNRKEGQSKDSRYFGCVSLDGIKGITGFRYFPFNDRFGKIK